MNAAKMARFTTGKICSLVISTTMHALLNHCFPSGKTSFLLMNPTDPPDARFGLSYTTFSFSDLVVSGVQVDQTGLITFSVALTVKNEGLVAGSEVAQLYISYPDTGLTTPVHQLKGFTKAKDVAPGASRDLHIDLDKYALAFWNSTTNEWTISPGKYILHVGASSEDFRLKGELELTKGITWQGL